MTSPSRVHSLLLGILAQLLAVSTLQAQQASPPGADLKSWCC